MWESNMYYEATLLLVMYIDHEITWKPHISGDPPTLL